MAHVFISYSREDSHFARLLKIELEKLGLELWIDTDKLLAGVDWRDGIDEAIQDSYAVIVVKSPDSFLSQYVTYEWAYALGIGVAVIPILLRPTKFHPRLEVFQHLDFTSPDPALQPWNSLTERLIGIRPDGDFRIRLPRNAPAAIRHIVEAFDSPNPRDRGAAIGSLSQMGHPLVVDVLAQAQKHPYRDVRTISAYYLAEDFHDVRARKVILDMLTNSITFERLQAGVVARRIADNEIVDALIKCLGDNSADRIPLADGGLNARRVCDVAAQALNDIGTPEALAAVEQWQRQQSGGQP